MIRIALVVLGLTFAAGDAHASIKPLRPLSSVSTVAAPEAPNAAWRGAGLPLALGLALSASAVSLTMLYRRHRIVPPAPGASR